MTWGSATFYVDREKWARYREELWNKRKMKVSARLAQLIDEDLAQLTDEEADGSAFDYANLQKHYRAAIRESDKIKKILKNRKTYDALKQRAEEAGLDFREFSNVKEVISKLLKTWDGNTEDLQIFISLLELGLTKRQFEQQIKQLQAKLYAM